jgi:hypothetical protein
LKTRIKPDFLKYFSIFRRNSGEEDVDYRLTKYGRIHSDFSLGEGRDQSYQSLQTTTTMMMMMTTVMMINQSMRYCEISDSASNLFIRETMVVPPLLLSSRFRGLIFEMLSVYPLRNFHFAFLKSAPKFSASEDGSPGRSIQ